MSFDLYIWHRPIPESKEHAIEICHRLAKEDESLVQPYVGIQGFITELLQQYPDPELEDVPDDEIDIGVWSVSPSSGEGYVALYITFSRVGEVYELVDSLAKKYRLILFDPQSIEYTDYTQS